MRREEWQGTAFMMWVLSGTAAVFLLRHPAGREAVTGPYGGALLAGSVVLVYLGWALGWTNPARLVGLGLSAAVAVVAAVLRLSPAWALGLEAALLLPCSLGGALARGRLSSLRVPELRLPRVSFHFAWPTTGLLRKRTAGPVPQDQPAPPAPAPSLCSGQALSKAEGGLPGWAETVDESWPAGEELAAILPAGPPEGQAAAPVQGRPAGAGPAPAEEVLLEAPALAAAEEEALQEKEGPSARPGRKARDEAVLLADAALTLLARAGVHAPALHLESGPGGVALELALSSRRQGEAVSMLRRAFDAAFGAAPAEALHGQALRLTFPAYARASAEPDGGATPSLRSGQALWAPLGRASGGRRMLANLPGVGTLLLVGADTAAVAAAVHAIVGAALAGRLSPRPERVLLADESGQYLKAYAGLAEVYGGPECAAAIKELAYERSRQGVSAAPVLAVILFPSPGVQAEIAHFAGVLAPAGVHAVVALDTPKLWSARELAVLTPARLVFRVGEAESRTFLGRPGAEHLGDCQAVYHLAESMREPQVLQAYAADEEDVQELAAALRRGGAPREEETLTTERELPEKVLAVLDAVLAVGRYSVRQVWDRVREQNVSRQAVFEMEDLFEAAGVVEVPGNPLGRRKVRVGSRAEALERLRRYLEEAR